MTHLWAQTIIDRVREMQAAGRTRILVAIDGRCAAGKTTLAECLRGALCCNVLHMDDFFLRPAQRTQARLSEPGGNVDYERFLSEALLPLHRGEAFTYRPYSCREGKLLAPVACSAQGVSVVEGAYSCHPALRGQYDLRVFLSVDPEEQLRRIRQRNGEKGAERFRSLWIPLEERYFDECGVKACADMVFCAEPMR